MENIDSKKSLGSIPFVNSILRNEGSVEVDNSTSKDTLQIDVCDSENLKPILNFRSQDVEEDETSSDEDESEDNEDEIEDQQEEEDLEDEMKHLDVGAILPSRTRGIKLDFEKDPLFHQQDVDHDDLGYVPAVLASPSNLSENLSIAVAAEHQTSDESVVKVVENDYFSESDEDKSDEDEDGMELDIEEEMKYLNKNDIIDQKTRGVILTYDKEKISDEPEDQDDSDYEDVVIEDAEK
ncbi:hypothetical protein HK096_011378 [Nowakowskiella sp. JEL0078]|nr:hypothetical protein HK096_011378 [Nowakowskiella sp. JEL0078]